MNSTIKKWVNFTKSTWPEFVMKLQELMELQLKEGDKAVYGSGEYMLAPSLTKFAIDLAPNETITKKGTHEEDTWPYQH